ncbi:MAG: chorismate-binding protein [Caryophanon sp.]|nr:chorismate-binding protein [Caryophanon sp.]
MEKRSSRTTIHTFNGDSLTPILLFRRLQGSEKFLLESSVKHEHSGRYSFIGSNPRKTYSGRGERLTEYVRATNKTYTHEGNLHVLLKRLMPRISNVTDFPFSGGAVGFIQHDPQPSVQFHIYETVIVFDHMTDMVTIIHTNIDAETVTPNIDALVAQLTTGETFEHRDTFEQYRTLRKEKPSSYLYYMEFQNETVFGTAPESFINVQQQHIHTHVITGAIAKGASYRENAVLIQDLRQNEQTAKAHEDEIHLRTEQLKSVSNAASIQLVKHTAALQSFDAIHLHSVLQAELSPVLHPIDALTTCTLQQHVHNAVGYIGFNGQLDFTNAFDATFTAHTQQTEVAQ